MRKSEASSLARFDLPNTNDELACPEKPNEVVEEHPFQAMVPDQLIGTVRILCTCERRTLHCRADMTLRKCRALHVGTGRLILLPS